MLVNRPRLIDFEPRQFACSQVVSLRTLLLPLPGPVSFGSACNRRLHIHHSLSDEWCIVENQTTQTAVRAIDVRNQMTARFSIVQHPIIAVSYLHQKHAPLVTWNATATLKKSAYACGR